MSRHDEPTAHDLHGYRNGLGPCCCAACQSHHDAADSPEAAPPAPGTTPQCAGPFADAYDCPVHDPRKHGHAPGCDNTHLPLKGCECANGTTAPLLSRESLEQAVREAIDKGHYSVIRAWLALHGGASAEIVIEEIAQLVKELAPVVAAPAGQTPTWQPIATAPKGEAVLVTNGTIQVALCGARHGRWQSIPGAYQISPTHWMPLPAPSSGAK